MRRDINNSEDIVCNLLVEINKRFMKLENNLFKIVMANSKDFIS